MCHCSSFQVLAMTFTTLLSGKVIWVLKHLFLPWKYIAKHLAHHRAVNNTSPLNWTVNSSHFNKIINVILLLLLYFCYLRSGKQERENESSQLLIISLKCPQWLRMGHTKAGNKSLNSVLLCGWHEPKVPHKTFWIINIVIFISDNYNFSVCQAINVK